jgi:NAD(P)-dependent dehydrogenase (short-subunit alcohol dehydrogenase family)
VNAKQLFDLTGRVAIISGGSMGLGLQMAEGLADMGASLAICARKKQRCQEAMSKIKRRLSESWKRRWRSSDTSTF